MLSTLMQRVWCARLADVSVLPVHTALAVSSGVVLRSSGAALDRRAHVYSSSASNTVHTVCYGISGCSMARVVCRAAEVIISCSTHHQLGTHSASGYGAADDGSLYAVLVLFTEHRIARYDSSAGYALHEGPKGDVSV